MTAAPLITAVTGVLTLLLTWLKILEVGEFPKFGGTPPKGAWIKPWLSFELFFQDEV